MRVGLEFAAAVAAGWTLTALAFGRPAASAAERTLRAALALLLGAGIVSSSLTLSMFLFHDARLEPAIPLAAVAAGTFATRRRISGASPARFAAPPVPMAITALFLLSMLIAAACGIEQTLREPEGSYDAWAVWNSRARFLARAISPEQEALSQDLGRAQFRTHADYPLLLPGLVVQGYRLLGRESVAVPAVISLTFGVLLAVVVAAGVSEISGAAWGLLAGAVLLSSPIFADLTARQCADVPLAAFVTAAVVIALFAAGRDSMRRLPLFALAGLTLSFGAWCKNEGIVFLIVVPLAFIVSAGNWRRAALGALWWAAGALPVVLLLLWFKFRLAPPSDLSSSAHEIAARVLSVSRWRIAFRAVIGRAFGMKEWGLHSIAAFAAIAWLAIRRLRGATLEPAAMRIGIAALLALMSFGAVYLITPHDVEWQIRYSVHRLVFTCWPALLIAILTAAASLQVDGRSRTASPAGQTDR